MATSQDDIASQLREALRVTDPELDSSVGSVVRKIIDAVAASISDAYVENHLLSYAYDVDAKVDADLDAFCQLFGISRIPPRRSVGTVVFTRTSDLTSTVFIPVGTEITSSTNTSLIVQTVTGGVLLPGVTTVGVAVQASVAGAEGNLAAMVLDTVSSPIQGISAVVNPDALTGGTSRETDSELRARWKRTVFRSLAGTESMFLGVALDDPDCFAANVVGAAKMRTEILQVPVSGDVVTQIPSAAFIYSSPVRVTRSDGSALVKDYDYTWVPTNPPAVHPVGTNFPPAGELITVEYQYLPVSSRNDPGNTITNRVDVFCGGIRAQVAQQSVVFSNSKVFQTSVSVNDFYAPKWLRADQTHPSAGNVFIPLAYGPILSVPSTMTVGGSIYGLVTKDHPMGSVTGSVTYAYTVVHEDTAAGWTSRSRFGLEWNASTVPVNGTTFTVGSGADYAYNQVPEAVQGSIDRWRLVGSDVVAHQAKQRWLRFALGIMYTQGSSPTTVQAAVRTAMGDYLNKMGFNASVQVSDALAVVHAVPGVDNVRFLNGSDVTGYSSVTPNLSIVGIQQIVPLAGVSGGTTSSDWWYQLGGAVTDNAIQSFVQASTGRAMDVYFEDNEVPVLGGIVFKTLARNSFGVA